MFTQYTHTYDIEYRCACVGTFGPFGVALRFKNALPHSDSACLSPSVKRITQAVLSMANKLPQPAEDLVYRAAIGGETDFDAQ